ncbi:MULTISPECIES: DUF1653 domain-containing protein [unclassified Microbacterium]|uniref:DUF1653 domain-containing protein n=1 Tax=unclassified Microbacterium TaxID=2609290 RepID=UPI00214C0EF6|nr:MULTISPECIES: DUF1653 domain-containing protein [unclassified Microbacterium]MCR2809206.1 DUF1653 domain-containing protein [Microbacterium sp. zg.B185]WIM20353.1 DUF1653 domain-containing protein [Microbacterium sp. zg-B185]
MSEVEPGIYQHFKGRQYEVIGTVRHSETEEQYVLYRPRYGEGDLWIRPLEMWQERVVRDGYDGPRFARVR